MRGHSGEDGDHLPSLSEAERETGFVEERSK
jgi:hypothetical protein